MTSLPELIQHGGSLWIFFPSALILGALHGLEPGHSKTMMAAFIISIRGTITQAILLGLSATFSHTLIVWLIAGAGLIYGRNWYNEANEAYFQLASAIIILAIASWMLWRVHKERRQMKAHSQTVESHGPNGGTLIDTGHGLVEISVYEKDMPPHFRLHFFDSESRPLPPENESAMMIETVRSKDIKQKFAFQKHVDFLQSTSEIPEPHEFKLVLTTNHGGHSQNYNTEFTEDHHHHEGLDLGDPNFHDAHQRAHANEIQQRFSDRKVTTGQIIVFGLTGGLIPCPSAITVLLLCLQIRRVALGFFLVLGFSVGLAGTMVTTGIIAALGMKHATKRLSKLTHFFQFAPYFASAFVILLGLYMGIQAWVRIHA